MKKPQGTEYFSGLSGAVPLGPCYCASSLTNSTFLLLPPKPHLKKSTPAGLRPKADTTHFSAARWIHTPLLGLKCDSVIRFAVKFGFPMVDHFCFGNPRPWTLATLLAGCPGLSVPKQGIRLNPPTQPRCCQYTHWPSTETSGLPWSRIHQVDSTSCSTNHQVEEKNYYLWFLSLAWIHGLINPISAQKDLHASPFKDKSAIHVLEGVGRSDVLLAPLLKQEITIN